MLICDILDIFLYSVMYVDILRTHIHLTYSDVLQSELIHIFLNRFKMTGIIYVYD
jgi:hypothetical protein